MRRQEHTHCKGYRLNYYRRWAPEHRQCQQRRSREQLCTRYKGRYNSRWVPEHAPPTPLREYERSHTHAHTASARTLMVWPSSVRSHCPVAMSQTLMVLSADPDASLPSAHADSAHTRQVWPSSVR